MIRLVTPFRRRGKSKGKTRTEEGEDRNVSIKPGKFLFFEKRSCRRELKVCCCARITTGY